jgi:nicotinate-nucleotide pyrophosphorylase (carboxylating)
LGDLTVERTIETLVRLALEEDLGQLGDVTSRAILPPDMDIGGLIVAKAPGVIAGLSAVEAVYKHLDATVEIQALVADGDRVVPGSSVAEIWGKAQTVLAGERVALNFLQRLSGIATLTAAFVAEVAGTRAIILDTRKTTPGWRGLEKYAVRMGGGQNHRMGLYDQVLIKDNHVDVAGSVTKAVQSVRAFSDARGLILVLEVRTIADLREALPLKVDRILLDNMAEEQLREAVALAKEHVPLEASGNITLEQVRAVAETGVDFISVGALTHSAPTLDLSMRIGGES